MIVSSLTMVSKVETVIQLICVLLLMVRAGAQAPAPALPQPRTAPSCEYRPHQLKPPMRLMLPKFIQTKNAFPTIFLSGTKPQ